MGASGCATKKYVQREVGEVNTKTATLTTEVEKTQERLGRNETRIDEVNREAQAGKMQASEAMTKAVDAERAAKGKLLYQVTLTDDQLKFPFGKAMINEDGQAQVDQAIAAIKQENKGVFVEIEGHTDSVGPRDCTTRSSARSARWPCATTCTSSTASRSRAWRSSPTARSSRSPTTRAASTGPRTGAW